MADLGPVGMALPLHALEGLPTFDSIHPCITLSSDWTVSARWPLEVACSG